MKSLTLTRGVALCVALRLLDATPALAASGESTPLHLTGTAHAGHASSSGVGSSIVRTVIGLLVVVAVIYGVSWILRQFKAGRSRPTGTGLASVSSLPLGNGRSVSLVRVGDELVLLGVSEQCVTRLASYTEAEAVEQGLIADPTLVVEAEPRLRELSAGRALVARVRELPAGRTVAPRQLAPSGAKLLETLRAMTVRQ